MKTRKEIIEDILSKNRKSSVVIQEMTLKFTLQNMQDALLFLLAKDLGVDILKEEARS